MISIIVPVYNAEKYLSECINSILTQTYNEFELILVNDGSTDNSLNICECYRKMDERVRIISIDNSGASIARKVGVEAANGEYIGFVDSDDVLHKEMYRKLFDLISLGNYDISIVAVEKLYQDGVIVFKNETSGIKIWKNTEAVADLLSQERKIPIGLWCKLYKKELFNNLRWPERLTYEDTYITAALLYKSKSIIQEFDNPMYTYRMTPNSVSSKKYNIHNMDGFKIHCMCLELLKMDNKLVSCCKRRIVRSFIYNTGITYKNNFQKHKGFIDELEVEKRFIYSLKPIEGLSIIEEVMLLVSLRIPWIIGIIYKIRKDTKGRVFYKK